MHGSPTVPKDCVDYVVFEKHSTDTEGRWRIHGKLAPKIEEEIVSATAKITRVLPQAKEGV